MGVLQPWPGAHLRAAAVYPRRNHQVAAGPLRDTSRFSSKVTARPRTVTIRLCEVAGRPYGATKIFRPYI